MGNLSRWLENNPSAEKRRAPRIAEPALLVYYWDGSVPEGRRIRDISISGAYIVTPERWYVGTIVRLILQGYKTTPQPDGGIVPSRSTSIPARVIRHGTDGIGVEFMFSNPDEQKTLEEFLATIPKGTERNSGPPDRGQRASPDRIRAGSPDGVSVDRERGQFWRVPVRLDYGGKRRAHRRAVQRHGNRLRGDARDAHAGAGHHAGHQRYRFPDQSRQSDGSRVHQHQRHGGLLRGRRRHAPGRSGTGATMFWPRWTWLTPIVP